MSPRRSEGQEKCAVAMLAHRASTSTPPIGRLGLTAKRRGAFACLVRRAPLQTIWFAAVSLLPAKQNLSRRWALQIEGTS